MAEKTNSDREILQAVLNALDQASEEVRERILQTVSTYYSLNVSNGQRLIPSGTRPTVHSVVDQRKLSFTDREIISPKDFLHEKRPKTASERVACLAYYLSNYRDMPHFKTIDISKLNTEAAQLKFSNPAQCLMDAIARGLIVPAVKGSRQISAIGERFVDALPNREEAKSVLATLRPRRRKKSVNSKKTRNATN